jgi:hypothetical protein
MLSYPRRLPSGQITCYLNRTYHVLTTVSTLELDTGVQTSNFVANGDLHGNLGVCSYHQKMKCLG